MSSAVLDWLQGWYTSQCDGEWEHEHGITIATLDNPGWSVEIPLAETVLSDRLRVKGERHLSEHNWLVYEVKDVKFKGFCGPENLSDLLDVFRTAVTDCLAESG